MCFYDLPYRSFGSPHHVFSPNDIDHEMRQCEGPADAENHSMLLLSVHRHPDERDACKEEEDERSVDGDPVFDPRPEDAAVEEKGKEPIVFR